MNHYLCEFSFTDVVREWFVTCVNPTIDKELLLKANLHGHLFKQFASISTFFADKRSIKYKNTAISPEI